MSMKPLFSDSMQAVTLRELVGFAPGIYQNRRSNFEEFLALLANNIEDAISPMFTDLKNRYSPPRNEQRFVHYTSVSALTSMLQNTIDNSLDYLRLYDSTHLNDPEEGLYMARLLRSDIRKAFGNVRIPSHAYIVSFVPAERNNRDNLVFWRTYGGDGQGCSIEILFKGDTVPTPVLYGKRSTRDIVAKVKDLLRDAIPILLDSIAPLKVIGSGDGWQFLNGKIKNIVCNELEALYYLSKSQNYRYEKEHRIIETWSAIRSRNDAVTFDLFEGAQGEVFGRHYYEHRALSTSQILVTETLITIGPAVRDKYTVKVYLEDLLQRANLLGPDVVFSDIEYRSR